MNEVIAIIYSDGVGVGTLDEAEPNANIWGKIAYIDVSDYYEGYWKIGVRGYDGRVSATVYANYIQKGDL